MDEDVDSSAGLQLQSCRRGICALEPQFGRAENTAGSEHFARQPLDVLLLLHLFGISVLLAEDQELLTITSNRLPGQAVYPSRE